MAARWCLVLLVLVLAAAGAEKGEWDPVIRMPGEKEPAGSHSHSGEGFEGEEDDAVGRGGQCSLPGPQATATTGTR
ncbi:unnamed protein product [Miscanthus lutarioriparius]|uniref:Uncharacterized protein n=1 Tax=Miscanthus lutarioriparius TaxID=422564 RepID=A0A811PYV4_9POAL|nr:unnamed protein product [Miscanthus lutarioriparius]